MSFLVRSAFNSTVKYLKIALKVVIIMLASIAVYLIATRAGSAFSEVDYEENKSYEISLVKADLETYGTMSERMQAIIISAIDSASTEFKIPVGLLHAILRVESDYRYWLDHDPIIVKGKKTCAKGIAAIVWEWWKDSLTVHNIAQVETDLYSPEISIRACAYIVRNILNRSVQNTSQEMLALQIARGYFGEGSYKGKTATDYKNKLVAYTSDLWMVRMTRMLKDIGYYAKRDTTSTPK